LAPRTIPILASQLSIWGTTSGHGAVGGFGIAFSIRSSRRWSDARIFVRFGHGIDDFE
jgi:hypothetical protein